MGKVPRPILFATLSILWIFPSIGAISILSFSDRGKGVPLENLLAALLLAAHAIFIFFAWRLRGFRALRG
jgi:hypothetical protein